VAEHEFRLADESILTKTNIKWFGQPPARATYIVAVLLPLAAAGIRAAFEPVVGPHAPYLLFVVAIVISACFGGVRASLVTTVTSTLLVSYFFLDPRFGFVVAREPAGNLARFFGVGVFISLLIGELRQALFLRTQSDEKFRALFNSMDEGFAYAEMIYDKEGRPVDCRYLEANPAFARETGLSLEGVIGRTLREILPDIEPFWIEHYGFGSSIMSELSARAAASASLTGSLRLGKTSRPLPGAQAQGASRSSLTTPLSGCTWRLRIGVLLRLFKQQMTP